MRKITDPEPVAQWAAYEDAAKKAADAYRTSPISLERNTYAAACYGCDRPTNGSYGICARCKREAGVA